MEIKFGVSNVLVLPTLNDEQKSIIVQSASFSVYDYNGTAIQSTTSATISGSYIRCTLSAISTAEENYRIDTTATSGSLTFYGRHYFDVVKMPLYPTLTDDDLQDAYPWLANKLWETETDWSRAKQLAWDEIMQNIRARGFRPALTAPSAERWKLPHLHLTLSNIFRSMFIEVGDKWHQLYIDHLGRYTTMMEAAYANFKYDVSEDAVIPPGSEISVSSYDLIR